jgi:excisionase family DNA binding protein
MLFPNRESNQWKNCHPTVNRFSPPPPSAKWLGVSTRTVCLWAECEEIPAIKIGRQWRFREGQLSEWLQTTKAAKVTNYPNRRAATAAI